MPNLSPAEGHHIRDQLDNFYFTYCLETSYCMLHYLKRETLCYAMSSFTDLLAYVSMDFSSSVQSFPFPGPPLRSGAAGRHYRVTLPSSGPGSDSVTPQDAPHHRGSWLMLNMSFSRGEGLLWWPHPTDIILLAVK